ncbi:hypothetical protein SRABI27_05198 [Pedobacter sp. Bi27]|nr:hypothetical protein SRABI36_05235 [Pedobacter sp. Bi36]CAH0319494.1 hypothetical protein SRABI27_05198 [Pedobacter sp. Bi27]CAH0320189.1 hypothetical protein SRABI126_05240 [Pedobacter sp. Bi126]
MKLFGLNNPLFDSHSFRISETVNFVVNNQQGA